MYVRRIGRDPAVMKPSLEKLIVSFSSSAFIDPKSKKPLLSSDAKKEMKALLKHVDQGCLMDDPEISLYFKNGVCKAGMYEGLQRYRCIRGTSDVEGAVHSKLIRSLSGFSYGAEFMMAHL